MHRDVIVPFCWAAAGADIQAKSYGNRKSWAASRHGYAASPRLKEQRRDMQAKHPSHTLPLSVQSCACVRLTQARPGIGLHLSICPVPCRLDVHTPSMDSLILHAVSFESAIGFKDVGFCSNACQEGYLYREQGQKVAWNSDCDWFAYPVDAT